ncbi:hypothetical protein [Campylobacter sp. MIT 97-5078]|uniref:hypothetical protein n=1 Tax=Campylobacter sp. MIT 97-5078 TaxID=1548153 RepID=UPI0005144DF4|nr:hypothetical protein [Campylobacter sp. MIT 97-5078]KGI55995.1 hypothetical protein LR59_09485 [Campylobacter sp. MIT 97-5078]KGI57457.1 hypothetical protein LR59_01765 [Campylobacter sp. MIT 97-5078]KGI57515.1 hypothetical protein LR59_02135 [Campylobacter sp. MIT 97-5078]TQR27381.1 mobilization protein [Campylobacter sp. MIT 97-5078]
MENNANNEVKEAILGLNGSKKTLMTQKRLAFDEKTMKLIEMMLPLYKEQFDDNLNENEKITALIQVALKHLFNTDFSNKIKEFS